MDEWRGSSDAVRQIPAYAGMTLTVVAMTWIAAGMACTVVGMTWIAAGMACTVVGRRHRCLRG